jgi:MoxR-like ATPase
MPGILRSFVEPNHSKAKETTMAKKSDSMIAEEVQEKLSTIRDEMNASLIERDEEIDITLTALIAQEHPLFVGPPGTAKSMLLDSLINVMSSSPAFNLLFNKFTTPEEVFGPISIQGLKSDVYRRVTTAKLPEAVFAFGDEIFKASTAILNTMLRILNERVYENGDGTFRKCPLLLFLAASNEWPPEASELGALFDRFLLRKHVKPISSPAGRRTLLFGRKDHTPKFTVRLTKEEVLWAHKLARRLQWSDEAEEGMLTIISKLNQEGIFPGDRRQFKSVRVVEAYAFLQSAEEVGVEHLTILQHTLWDDPQSADKAGKIVISHADPTGAKIAEIMAQMEDVLRKCNPTEAVPKMQDMQQQVNALPKHPKRLLALECLTNNIKIAYDRVIGVRP